jgi:hypothetical protein
VPLLSARAVETFPPVSGEIRVLCFHAGLYGSGVGISLSQGPSGVGFEPAKIISVGLFQRLKYPLLGLAGLSAGLQVLTRIAN